MSGMPMPSISSGLSLRMNSIVLPANASRCATSPLLASCIKSGISSSVRSVPSDQPAVTGVHAAVVQPDPRAVLDLLEDLGPGLVDQRHAVGDQHLGSQVRVAARDRRRRVDDGGDVGVDQRVGGDPVEIERVEHDDVPGSDATQQPIDVAIDAGGAGDARPWAGITGEQR